METPQKEKVIFPRSQNLDPTTTPKTEFSPHFKIMAKLTRKCKPTGQSPAVMDSSHPHVGAKTRARSLAEAQPKRRKSSAPTCQFSDSELNSHNSAQTPTQTQTASSENCATPVSGQSPPSCCSSNESLRSVIDLEDTHAEFENSPYKDRMRDLHSESTDLESTGRQAAEVSSDLKSTVEMPTSEEIEDFFSQLEKDQDDTKKFTEKYNFDFASETPLEGRFEWVPVKP